MTGVTPPAGATPWAKAGLIAAAAKNTAKIFVLIIPHIPLLAFPAGTLILTAKTGNGPQPKVKE
jgi:hypothetical protein